MYQTNEAEGQNSAKSPQEKPDLESSIKGIAINFFCGSMGGVANILSGQPFDTIKVRMQILNSGFLQASKDLVTKEGFRSLYKGIVSPLCSVPLIYAVSFGSFEAARRAQGLQGEDEATTKQAMLAGMFAGLSLSTVLTPNELIKIKMQMNDIGTRNRSITTLGMLKQVFTTHGFKGLYKGHLITLCRELPSNAVYFGVYNYLSKNLRSSFGDSLFFPLLAGGIAGLCSYTSSYPIDVIKTKLQADNTTIRRYPVNQYIKDGGIIRCVKETWKINGARGFVKGFSACAMRAVIAEGSTFFAFENIKKLHFFK